MGGRGLHFFLQYFVATLDKCCDNAFLGGYAQTNTILQKKVLPINYNMGVGGGVLGAPNLHYVINDRPLNLTVMQGY